ncbi:response regulator transcription factor [Microbulbifer sp. JMSA004]|uniref:response regulator transcription factor n=1 Tax=unclassified Microbulbifer TaxID=2619833 RepID=UPI0024AE2EC8|nr:response regulator transcription factor [Microbulbifer sp. VAAF005]WHI47171.1 response regulator transcription factor [Microbulbifer sp. VAAF005]
MSQKSPSQFNILIVEDDRGLNDQLSEMIQDAGYQVNACFDGNTALLEAAKQQPQLILLDLMLPEMDGISLLKILRKSSQVPVIILTAKGAEEERITGLRYGADDYVAKPFNQTELLLRIEALLRRSQPAQAESVHYTEIDNLRLDLNALQVFAGGQPIEFTAAQFKLLWELAIHRGEVLSKAYLSQQVLNRTLGAYDRSLDMHLSRVRRKLTGAGWRGDRLQTVHGKGYCLK